MKTYRLVVNPFAELDLHTAKDWYELRKPGLGDEFVKEIDSTIIRTKENPYQFGFAKKKNHRAVVKRFPYGIFYIITNDLITVFAVFHFSVISKFGKTA